jgi:hypothetical protein
MDLPFNVPRVISSSLRILRSALRNVSRCPASATFHGWPGTPEFVPSMSSPCFLIL